MAQRKRSSSGASEEVRKEMLKRKAGKRTSRKQAIAIGLSKARRKGKAVPAPKAGKTSAATRKKAKQDSKAGQTKRKSTTKKSASKRTTSKRKS
jgi:hypothetical protein